ncbi:hypothetical protein V9T40_013233 [Parthenolecanium corni]|uniref:Glucose-methanol-choline oxidoreductase C-terminal domain-containing protein n=1 Tax=Parthenolecanium corni TaxID=536013 RepID=A0AAN9Y4Z2_9HEMI
MFSTADQAIEFSQTESMQRFASSLLSTPLPPCRRLTFGSDQYWTCVARHITTNLHHQAGTCKMGPHTDPDAVVNPELQVRGVQSLRIVDASVMPLIPAAHTNAVVFMIGEKAADLIKVTWGATV